MCLTFYLLWLLLPCLVVAVILILCHGHGVSYRERFTLKYTVCCFWPWMYCLIVTVIYWLYFIFLTISSSHIFDSLIMSSIMSSQDHELDIGVDYVCVCQVCVCVWCVCLLVCPVRVPACLSVCVHWGTSTCTLVAVRTEEVCVSLKGNGVCVLSRSYHLTMSLNTHTHTHNNGCRCPLPYLICTQTSQILMWFSDILNECCWW